VTYFIDNSNNLIIVIYNMGEKIWISSIKKGDIYKVMSGIRVEECLMK
jgi:hypothetical protein